MTKRIMPLLVVLLSLSVAVGTALAAPKAAATLNPTNIPQFVDPLPLLSVQGGPIETLANGTATVTMEEFKANILPVATKLPNKVPYTGTYVWGYRSTAPPTLAETYIGPVFVVPRGIPSNIRWVNNLPQSKPPVPNLTFWWAATDQTMHWADPLGLLGPETNDCAMNILPGAAPVGGCAQNYTGPVPAVVHLHGGEVPPQLDGGPDAWFTSDGLKTGHGYYSASGANANEAIYNYPNTQEAANIWFHDHTLGITRLNVYAGLAGGYIIYDDTHSPPDDLGGIVGAAKTIPLVIQDRMFDTTGQLFFPSVGINPEHPFWIPEFVGDVIVVNGKSWPFLNVGPNRYRFLFLNGSNARAYELDLFDRATGLPGPPMWVIGTDGGYLDNPVMLNPALKQKLIIMPGERYEVVVDFSGGTAGQVLELRNTARTPYPGGATVQGSTTGRIMQFRVQATAPNANLTVAYDPAGNGTLRGGTGQSPAIERLGPTVTTGATGTPIRRLTLNEVMGPGGPLEVLVNNTKWSGDSAARTYGDFVSDGGTPHPTRYSEIPKEGSTEVWEVINLTADAHPIHLHLVQFQLLGRQPFDARRYLPIYDGSFPGGTINGVIYPAGMFMPAFGPPLHYAGGNADVVTGGDPKKCSDPGAVCGGNPDVTPFLLRAAAPPLPQEMGWKDTVIMYPGEVTRIVVRWAPTDLPAGTSPTATSAAFPFDPNGGHGYVWHCHIIDHEDNEMMRPDFVQLNPAAPAAIDRLLVKGADY